MKLRTKTVADQIGVSSQAALDRIEALVAAARLERVDSARSSKQTYRPTRLEEIP